MSTPPQPKFLDPPLYLASFLALRSRTEARMDELGHRPACGLNLESFETVAVRMRGMIDGMCTSSLLTAFIGGVRISREIGSGENPWQFIFPSLHSSATRLN